VNAKMSGLTTGTASWIESGGDADVTAGGQGLGMTARLVALGDLDLLQHAVVSSLLRGAFPTHPDDLITVELQRATNLQLGTGLVAVDESIPVGCVLARSLRPGHRFIVYLAVATSHRRQRIASHLLDAVVDTDTFVELYVDNDNIAAHRLYRAAGLSPTGRTAPAGQQHWQGYWHSGSSTTLAPDRTLATAERTMR
jgi:GNAT superfamily N-acetyltransferase